MAAQEMI